MLLREILTGSRARLIWDDILGSLDSSGRYPNHTGVKGYFKEDKVYLAFDNSDNKLWMCEFKSKKKALEWLKL